ncbi:unnamed protein product [Lactuca saligna]|uniref:DUF4283 domain-containing protein n=1 Tax=Lactuca saligna TaxID=75948 RepID=A0AA35V782_LACSI|nr:unnamed protein product [Lactuca saligna]
MGFIPILSCFPPWQLGVSTLVGATASSISKWWDNYPSIPGIGYVFLKLYHKWVGCFPCIHKNNHFRIFWHKYKATAIRCIPDFIGSFSFEVDYFLLHLGLIPISRCFYPRQLGFSTYVGATASSISKWWDIHPAIHGIGYVNLRLYHLQVGCFLCYHKNNHTWSFMDPFLLIAVWFIPDFIGIFSFEVVNFLKQMGLIPVSWKFLPRQLGISTLVGATASSISKWWDIYPAIHWIGGWDFIQGQFRNSWIIILEELLKSNWLSLGNKEVEDNLKKIWKCWDLLENNGFSIILSRVLKNLFWSLLDSKVKIGKKVINYLVEKIGKNCMKNIVQSSKLIAIFGFSFVWRYLQTIVVLNDLANDSLELDVPWKHWKTNIIQTLDYLFEYEAIFRGLTWRKIGSYMKIEDLEDFVNWKVVNFDFIVFFFVSYIWFHSLCWSWTWKWIGWNFSLGFPVLVSGLVGILVIGSLAGAGISSSLIEFNLKRVPIVYTIGDRMFWKIGSMFGMNYKDPPDPANKNLYEDDLEADVGAKRRGRRAMHKEFSPYSMIKPLRSKEKMEAKINRLREEKKYLNTKSIADGSKEVLRAGVREIIKSNYGKENIDPQFIKSELEAFDKVIANQKKLEEEKGFVLLQVTSDMVKGYNSSKNLVGGSSPSSPVIQANMGMDAGTVTGSNNRISAGTKNDKGNLVDESKVTKDFISSKLMKMGSSASGPGSSSSGPGPVIETNDGKGILGKFPVSQDVSVNSGIPVVFNANPIDPISCNTNCNDEDMKDSINENGNLEVDYGNNMKKEQGANFLNMDFSKPVLSPAAKLVNEFNKKSYDRMVESTNNVVDLNIKVIPKVDGKPSGKVELPYADLMLGGAPYHATLYGFFVGKKLAFPTVNHFSFKMWKMYGLKDIMVNDEGFFFFKFDSKEGMMSVLEGGPWLINNVPMFVQRWRPGLVLSKPQINSVPVWVKVFNVPLEYWNSKGITLIANEIGKPIAMDKITQKMCNEHWGRPTFMRFLVEMSAESDWMKELSVVSIDFGTGEKVESKCRVEYAWRPDVCNHCKIYGHKDSNCGILNGAKNDNGADVAVNREEDGKKDKIDDDGFILVTKKSNKGQKFNNKGVIINEEGKVDLIKSLEKNTKPVSEGDKGGNNEGKSIEEVGNLKKDGTEKGVFQSKEDKNGKVNGTGVFIPKEKMGIRVKNVIENFNAKKDGMQGKKEENQKKVYVPKKQVDLKVSSNFDKSGSTSGKDNQDEILSQNPFDVLADLGLRDMSYLDEIDQEMILTGGGQEMNTENSNVDQ